MTIQRAIICVVCLFGFVLCDSTSGGDEGLKIRACRSVHLSYPGTDGLAFYNEVTVDESAIGTYFSVCGWDKGYFGMQELGNGKKVLIFSVWDSNQNDPKAVKDADRVKLLYKDDQVRIGRFGGEGSGGQSFLDYDWKVGKAYRFLVTANVNGDRTEYAGFFYIPEVGEWKHLVTFSTIAGGKLLRGYYSFVEDFKRDGLSATKVRKAHYGNGWVMSKDGQWIALTRAKFTADSNPATNIDAGVEGDSFYLATGGQTKNAGVALRKSITLSGDKKRSPPQALPGVTGGEKKDSSKPAAFGVQVIGSGPPMILIPGLSNGANVWDGTVEHFKDRYECHLLTLAGFAGRPPIGEPFLETVRDELIAYIRQKKLKRPVIVGHSLGGWMALWVATSAPQDVGPVISVDGPPFIAMGMTPQEAQQRGIALREWYEKMTADEFSREVRTILTKQIRDEKEANRVAQLAIKSDPKAVGLAFVEARDLRDELKVIRSPVLMLGQTFGAADPAAKEKMYQIQMAAAPRHKVVMAPKAGHYIQLDEPEFFYRELERFLREMDRE